MITLNAKQQEEPIENLHLNWGSAGVRREDRQKFGLTHACLLFSVNKASSGVRS
jgi:hypothetical protein